MPTLYGAHASPFVRKVRVVLNEKGIAYEHDPVVPFGVSDEYRQISPLGRIPAFRDGERTLADSSVICAYLERTHPTPALYPSDPYEYARALWFEEYADGGMIPIIGPKIFLQRFINPRFFNKPTDEAVVQKAVDEDLPPLFAYLEREIGDREFIVGRTFTIGDVGIGTALVNLYHTGVRVDPKRWPHLAAYADRIHARPSFQALIDEERAMYGIAA